MIPAIRTVIASSGIKVAASADVTPTPTPNWSDVTGFIPFASTGQQTISGINTTINLYFEYDFGDGLSIEYRKNGGSWTPINEFATVAIANGDTLDWGARGSGGYQSIMIKNASDGNALLDTIEFVLE